MEPGKQSRRGRPKDEGLAERRREEILAAATSEFAREGYRSTDVQEIADRCAVGKGTVYRYFASKEELFLGAVHRVNALMSQVMRESMDTGADPVERLRRMILRFLVFFDENPDFVEVMIQERAEFRERRLTFFEYRDALHEELNEFSEQLEATGCLRNPMEEPEDSVVSELLYGVIFSSRLTGHAVPAEKRREQITDVLLNGVLK